MFRAVLSKAVTVTRTAQRTQFLKCLSVAGAQKRSYSAPVKATDEEMNTEELIAALRSDSITGWDIRTIVNTTQGMDEIPSAPLLEALMQACRTVNDYALAVRILEALKAKCGKQGGIYNSLIQSVKPTLDELGILTPEEMGYDKPELYMKHSYDVHN